MGKASYRTRKDTIPEQKCTEPGANRTESEGAPKFTNKLQQEYKRVPEKTVERLVAVFLAGSRAWCGLVCGILAKTGGAAVSKRSVERRAFRTINIRSTGGFKDVSSELKHALSVYCDWIKTMSECLPSTL